MKFPVKIDGFVKSPTSALRYILRHCSVPDVRLIPQDLRALTGGIPKGCNINVMFLTGRCTALKECTST
jgi:hypothetical protein